MKKFNKIIILALVAMLTLTGCNFTKEKKNTDSEVAKTKNTMLNDLDNFSYNATITTSTGFGDISTTLDCKQDNVNKITYCKTNTIGVTIEEYIDIKNKKTYTKTTAIYGGGDLNGKWVSSKYTGNENSSNSWLNLSDYIFDLKEEQKDGGKYYSGTISSKKLAEAIAQTDSTIDTKKVVNEDIPITIFINSSNYIESMTFEIEIIGITQKVSINYKDFNTSGTLTISSEALVS